MLGRNNLILDSATVSLPSCQILHDREFELELEGNVAKYHVRSKNDIQNVIFFQSQIVKNYEYFEVVAYEC